MIISDKKWQAEDDMRTLARAKEIESDKTRHAAAKKQAELKKCNLLLPRNLRPKLLPHVKNNG